MTDTKSNSGLIASIIFASTVISGSLVFFGLQFFDKAYNESDLQDKIAEGIDAYVENKQKEYNESQGEANKPKLVEGDFTDDDAVLGDEDAPVTIVEFSDYECPFCAAFYNGALVDIKKKYIDTGKVKLVYRDYPLSFHPNAYPFASFAECARDQGGDEVYFKVHDKIFGENGSGAGFSFDNLSKFSEGLGVDAKKLKDCFDSDKFKNEINSDQAAGSKAGVNGTPGFLVNGWVVSGAQPFAEFEKLIEQELAKND